jgi:hypothetical protein
MEFARDLAARVSSAARPDPCRQDRRLDSEHLPSQLTAHETSTISIAFNTKYTPLPHTRDILQPCGFSIGKSWLLFAS